MSVMFAFDPSATFGNLMAAQRLIDVRNKLAETIRQIDATMGERKHDE